MFYLILFSVVSCLTIYSFIKPVNKVNRYIFISLWLLVVIAFPIGRDLETYMMVFERVSTPIADSFKYNSQRNLGFNMFTYYTKMISNNYMFFRAVFNIIVCGLCSYTMYKESKNILFSMFLFICNGIFIVYYGSGIRQMLSMAVFFFAYFKYLIKGKEKAYILSSLLAFSFHDVGIVTFIIYIIYKLRNFIYKHEKRNLLIMLLSSVLLCFLFVAVIPNIINNIEINNVFQHALLYLNKVQFSVAGVGLRTIMLGFNVGLFLLSKDKNEDNHFMFLTMFSAYCIYILFSGFGIFARIYDYIAIIELVMIPNLLMSFENKKISLITLAMIICMNAFLMYVDISEMSVGNSYNFKVSEYPFVTVFEQKRANELMIHR